MGRVLLDIPVWLDGFIAGPNDGSERSLGDEGERLFDWIQSGPDANRYNECIKPPGSSHLVV